MKRHSHQYGHAQQVDYGALAYGDSQVRDKYGTGDATNGHATSGDSGVHVR